MQFASEFYDFIQDNRDADTDALLLRYARKPLPFSLQDAVNQIIGRKKAAAKIPDLIERGLLFPSTLLAEQCSSQFMADLHASLIAPEAHVVDLTFGLGVDAFTIARKAASVHGVEMDAKAAEYGRMNALTLGLHNVSIQHSTAQKWAETYRPEIDTIFIDPARRKSSSNRAFRFEDCSPNLCELLSTPGFQHKKLIIKASPMLDIDYAINAVPGVSRIIIAAVKGECKEMIIVCDTEAPHSSAATITAIDIGRNATSWFTVSAGERTMPTPRILSSGLDVQPGMFLLEPNVALMKVAPWHQLESQHPTIIKLSQNAHLFVSPTPIANFPGRVWKIKNIYTGAKQAAHDLKDTPANIATRAYPLTPQELRHKLKLKPCADQTRFLIGTSVGKSNILILADTL